MDNKCALTGIRDVKNFDEEKKTILFEKINSVLSGPRAEYERLIANPAEIDKILEEGAKRARIVAEKTFERVHKAMLG